MLTIKNKKIQSYKYELINLNNILEYDAELNGLTEDYNQLPYLEDVIGYYAGFLDKSEVGCFYTDALYFVMDADISFQNTGGVRATLNEGEITKREFFEISPFNNGTVIYEMTVGEIKKLFERQWFRILLCKSYHRSKWC